MLYNKQSTTRINDNDQSYDQEESKLNSIITNTGAHAFNEDKQQKLNSIRMI